MMRQAGISSFRDEVGWPAIEKTKGQYEMPAAWDEFVPFGAHGELFCFSATTITKRRGRDGGRGEAGTAASPPRRRG
jgi:hypothetical protein